MSRSRSRASLIRQRCRHSSTVGGSAGSAVQSGSDLMTSASVSDTSSPSKARRPVSSSNSTHPKAQMSARLSTGRPRACSGLMYAAVPSSIPIWVSAGLVMVGESDPPDDTAVAGSNAFASPKSRIFTVPSGRCLILAGFRSRWMMPCSCAASRPSVICLAIASVSSTGTAPCMMRSASVGPSTSSMAIAMEAPERSRP